MPMNDQPVDYSRRFQIVKVLGGLGNDLLSFWKKNTFRMTNYLSENKRNYWNTCENR